MALLNLQNITHTFGSKPVFDNISMQIQKGEKISLLGRNGTGKSTMMKLINGQIEPDSGNLIREAGLKTSLLPQEFPDGLCGTIYHVIAEGAVDIEHMNHHMSSFEEQKARKSIERTISMLGLDPLLNYEDLSAGMKRRVLLGRALVSEPDILLLDEPTNHLDIDAIKWLEDFFSKYNGSLFFVTHDRAFMQKIANRILELDRGRIFDWRCDYTTFLQRKEAWLESEETQNMLFDKKLAKEEVWIRKGIKARRTRNEGRVRELKKMREERAERRDIAGKVKMSLQKAETSGKMIIEAEDVRFGFSGKTIIDRFSARIMRGDKIGIMGPNGCGKSTLIKILLGQLEPLSGTVRSGARIDTAYFDQMRDQFDEEKSIKDNVADGNEIIDINGKGRHIVGYLQDFLFPPDMIDKKVKVLSGGEKNRLMLAKLFTRPANLIVMDEPTNDLDIETVELLEDLLLEYQGTLLLVSHDREFINNVVTSTFVFEGNSCVNEYAGGYDDWILQRKNDNQEKAVKESRERKTVKKTKMSFNEKKELESIPAIIVEKEDRIKEIHSMMTDPLFYKENGTRVNDIKAELEALEKQTLGLYARWEELLELEKETIK